MNAHPAARMGITVLSVVALVASGASPIAATPAMVPFAVSPITSLTTPVRPAGLAVDGSGAVYVAGFGAGINGDGTTVSVFAPGASSPTRTLTGLSSPWDVAVKASTGEVFVSNYLADTVSVFPPGATTAARTLTGVSHPTGLAFDGSGSLLVSSYTGHTVSTFQGTSTTPTSVFPTANGPGGIAVDPLTNYLYVTSSLVGVVVVHDLQSAGKVLGTVLGLSQPFDIDLQVQTGIFYVSEFGNARVAAFTRATTTIDDALSLTDVNGPWGVAVSPRDGSVHVSDNPTRIRVFPPVVSAVTGVIPASGPVTGGTPVIVAGMNLGTTTSVTFGGVGAPLRRTPTPDEVGVFTPPAAQAGPVKVEIAWGDRSAGLSAAFTYTAVAPGPATGVSGTRGTGQVSVSWTPPAFTGGVALTGYTVAASPGPAVCATTATSCTITGLTNGTPYTFTVTTANAAALSSVSAASAPVTPVIAMSQKVKAKSGSYRAKRRGTATLVYWAKKPTKANRMVTRTCTNGTVKASAKLCKFTVSKSGKVKVRTKGYRNVQVKVSIVTVPKTSAGPTYGPSPTWTRTWRVR